MKKIAAILMVALAAIVISMGCGCIELNEPEITRKTIYPGTVLSIEPYGLSATTEVRYMGIENNAIMFAEIHTAKRIRNHFEYSFNYTHGMTCVVGDHGYMLSNITVEDVNKSIISYDHWD